MEHIIDKFQEIAHIWNPEPASIYVIKLFTSLLTCLLSMSLNSWVPSTSNMIDTTYDYVIVGGGTSGLVLASLLSINTNIKILVIEAGGEAPLSAEIPYLSELLYKTRYEWHYTAVPQNRSCKQYGLGLCRVSLGRMFGGSDFLHPFIFQTGTKRDWNRWENFENPGWNWDSVYPYFKRLSELEALEEYNDLKMNRLRMAIFNAADELELGRLQDEWESIRGKMGFGWCYGTVKNGVNNHAGRMFLKKVQYNVHFLKLALVSRVLFDSGTKRVAGIEFYVNNDETQLRRVKVRREVVLCAGAVNTAKILLLSGLGPKQHLEDKDIRVVEHLPGVGRNLQDHVQVPVIFYKLPMWPNELDEVEAVEQFILRRQGVFTTIGLSNMVGYMHTGAGDRSDYPNIQINHVFVYKNQIKKFFLKYDFAPTLKSLLNRINKNTSILVQIPILIKPKSTGVVQLHDAHPFTPPQIDPQYLSDPNDLYTLTKALKSVLKMGETKAFKTIKAELITDFYQLYCKHCSSQTNQCLLECLIENFSVGRSQLAGTARMGKCSWCSSAVVNTKFQVHGVQGLRVVDASVMPEIIGGGIYATKILLSIRAAEFILTQNHNIIKNYQHDFKQLQFT